MACLDRGFAYAGTQNGSECWCGNAYGGQGPSGSCTIACTGDTQVMCGGAYANSVYATMSLPPAPTYVGCFADSDVRDLPYSAYNNSYNTVQSCAADCVSRGYAYAGLQGTGPGGATGSQCYCGNSYGDQGQSFGCTTSCTGNSAETCGGNYANSVWRMSYLVSCDAIHTTYELLPSGQYTIDPDGAGPVNPTSVYCDMMYNDGKGAGGWTLIESIQSGEDPSATTSGVVTQGTTSAMPLATVMALALVSTQVHIRTPGSESMQSVTSVAGSSPIDHLQMGQLLNSLSDSQQVANWTGPYATSGYLSFSCSTSGYSWPSVYWACGNATGLTLRSTSSEWQSSANTLEPFEVYVR